MFLSGQKGDTPGMASYAMGTAVSESVAPQVQRDSGERPK
jgi:hypothetical protein